MKLSLTKTFLVVCLFSGSAQLLLAQAAPTAVRRLSPSAFVMISGVETGVAAGQQASFAHGGHNLSVTAGGDLGVYSFSRYVLAVEVRGTFPFNSGKIAGLRDIVGGVRISREPTGIMGVGTTHFRPYADALYGRNQMNFPSPYIVNGNPALLYKQTAGAEIQAGGGVEYDFHPHLSVKVDAQAMLSQTPVIKSNTSGYAFGGQVSAGITYRLGAR